MNFDIVHGKNFIFNLCFVKKIGVIFTIFYTFLHNLIKKYKNLNKNMIKSSDWKFYGAIGLQNSKYWTDSTRQNSTTQAEQHRTNFYNIE